MAGQYYVFLLIGYPLGFVFPLAVIISAYKKPKAAEGDWSQFLQFWLGVTGSICMVTISIAGGVYLLLGAVISLVVLAGALVLIFAEAFAGRRQSALIDLGLLFLVALIGYPFISAYLQ